MFRLRLARCKRCVRWFELLFGFTFGLVLALSHSHTGRFVTSYDRRLSRGQSHECLALANLAKEFLSSTSSASPATRSPGSKHIKRRRKHNLPFIVKKFRRQKFDNNSIADLLKKRVRVHCSVFLFFPDEGWQSTVDTWGKRCTKLVFFSHNDNVNIPVIGLGRITPRSVMSKAFRYIYEKEMDEFDWYIGTSNDTYVIMENLRHFLTSQLDAVSSPNNLFVGSFSNPCFMQHSFQNLTLPLYFGHHHKKKPFVHGGPGIILSKGGLKLFGDSYCKKAYSNRKFMACLKDVGVLAGNSSDILGRLRFYSFDPGTYLTGELPMSFLWMSGTDFKRGSANMSPYSIGFHNIEEAEVYSYEWYLYHVRPFGIRFGHKDLNKPLKLI